MMSSVGGPKRTPNMWPRFSERCAATGLENASEKSWRDHPPEAWNSPPPRHFLYGLHEGLRRWSECGLRLVDSAPPWGESCPPAPAGPALRAPVWCSSCRSRCSPGPRCPVRRWIRPPPPGPPSSSGEALQTGGGGGHYITFSWLF